MKLSLGWATELKQRLSQEVDCSGHTQLPSALPVHEEGMTCSEFTIMLGIILYYFLVNY